MPSSIVSLPLEAHKPQEAKGPRPETSPLDLLKTANSAVILSVHIYLGGIFQSW